MASKCFVLKKIDRDGKLDAKPYEAIFLGYSLTSRAYRVFNLKKRIVEESIDVIFHEPNNDLPRDEDDDAGDNDGSNKATARSAKATATSDSQQADKTMEQAATTSTAQHTDSQQAGTSSQPADNAISVDDTIKQLSKLNLGGSQTPMARTTTPVRDVHEEISQNSLPKATRAVNNHPPTQIIGDVSEGIKTKRGKANFCAFVAFQD